MTVKQLASVGAVLAVTLIGVAGCTTVPSADGMTADQQLSRQLATQRIAEHKSSGRNS